MTTPPPRKLHLKTWGCQMNVYDSGRMADVLAPLGYGLTDEVTEADLVILNTCHIREHASEKLFSELGRLRGMQEEKAAQGGRLMVGVAGCVAQAEGAEILKRAPHVDMVFGPQTYHQLPEMVGRALRLAATDNGTRQSGVVNTDFPAESKFDHLPEEQSSDGISAFLSVQEGCDKFCSFCVVPYTRGAEFSRPAAQVVKEARRLVAQGVREITLLGQNVNAYHGEAGDGAWSLGRLIRELAEIDGLARIRYTTSHPRDMQDDLITAHRDVPQLMPYMHLPVQCGSNVILQAMNRKHTREDYLRIVERLREMSPQLTVASDFIVGFPGEREEDFEQTLDIVMKVGFTTSYSFAYSPRPGTPASGLGHQVPEEVKAERLKRLNALLAQQQTHFNLSKVGSVQPVLFVKHGTKPGQLIGKSPFLQSVVVSAPDSLIGRIADVRIEAAYAASLHGVLLNS